MYLRLGTGFSGVTQIAVLDRPGNVAVMAGAAVFAVDDLQHADFIPPGLELEAQVGMANLAAKTYPVKPMWEHDGAHPGIF
jgi:hypothetical protein